jgi:hypothetical protein
MDASDRANTNGNGHVPETGSPPSAIPASGLGHPPEPLVVVDSDSPPVKPWRAKPKQRAFLAAVAQTGNITAAAKLSKVGRTLHYEWSKTQPEYAEAFNAAMDQACDLLEVEARRRAMKGIREPVYYLGHEIGHVQKYSDTLLIFLLKGSRPEKYRERYEHTGAGGKPLHPDKVDVHVKLDLKVLNDDELEQYAGLVSKLAARGGAGTLPGQN